MTVLNQSDSINDIIEFCLKEVRQPRPKWNTVVPAGLARTRLSAEKLWEVLSEVEAWPDWSPLHRAVAWQQGSALTVGARFEQQLDLGFPVGRTTEQVTLAFAEAGRRAGWVGDSGLTVAHLLHGRHELTLFEAEPRIGGHTHTVRVDTPNETHHVDTGFIVFNDRNYPNFERLLRALGVGWQASEMSFSVSDRTGDFEYASGSPNGLFAQRRHLAAPTFHRMVADLHRFHRAAGRLLEGDDEHISLSDWLEQQRFSRAFIERLIVPQVSAVWSADPRSLWSFPARFLAEFFANHGMLGFRNRPRWRAVRGGSARYVEALTAPFAHQIRLRAPVTAVERAEDHVLVTVRGAEAMRFDHVVLATHSDQALALLGDASPREREILSSIPYHANEAVLHTDARLLPRRRRAWASWNYHLLDEPSGQATVTYHMNRLQSLSAEREFCVTLNQTARIDPERVITRIQYAHPVYTPISVRASSRVAEISGTRRTHFCGAYWGWGFHEDGVNSALRVAAAFGARL